MAGFGGAADGKASQSTKKPQLNFKKWFNLAIYSHKTGRLREAESIYKKMIAAGTSDPAVFCNLGILCKNSGRIEEAVEHYEQALDFEPNDPQIYSNIGNLYRDIGKLAREALCRVGLEERLTHYPSELSGGQQQRVAIARALVNDPGVILADEPTGNLDKESGRRILELFGELHRNGATILLITHDDAVACAASRVVRIEDGELTSRSTGVAA